MHWTTTLDNLDQIYHPSRCLLCDRKTIISQHICILSVCEHLIKSTVKSQNKSQDFTMSMAIISYLLILWACKSNHYSTLYSQRPITWESNNSYLHNTTTQANQQLFYTNVRVSWSPLNYICLVKFVFLPPSSRFSHQSPTPTHFNCQDPCTTIADISKHLFLLVHWDCPRRHTIPQPADVLTQTALISNALFFLFVYLSLLTYYYLLLLFL